MALTPQGLVEVVAQQLAMTESRVKNYDRKLMEAGLRTKKGHGRGSAIMTMKDAALLLIAIASTEDVNDAATTAAHLWDFPLHESADPSPLQSFIEADAREIRKLGPAVCAVMSYLAAAPLPSVTNKLDEDAILGFEVIARSGIPTWARIKIILKKRLFEFDYRKKAHASLVGGLEIRRLVISPALQFVAKSVAGVA
jgi:hypothetical protein